MYHTDSGQLTNEAAHSNRQDYQYCIQYPEDDPSHILNDVALIVDDKEKD